MKNVIEDGYANCYIVSKEGACCFYFNESGTVVPADFISRASALSVRCVKE